MENKIAKRLLDRREAKNLSRRELAELIGTNDNQIWRYETGRNEPTAEMIYKLSKALDTTSDYLLGITESFEVVNVEQQRIILETPLGNVFDHREKLDSVESAIVQILNGLDAKTKLKVLRMIRTMLEIS